MAPATCGSSGSRIRRACRGLGALGAGFVVPVEVWELQEGQILTELSARVVPLKKTLTRGIPIVSELWELWGSSGRGVGAPGAGFVVPVAVWELLDLDS